MTEMWENIRDVNEFAAKNEHTKMSNSSKDLVRSGDEGGIQELLHLFPCQFTERIQRICSGLPLGRVDPQSEKPLKKPCSSIF